MNDQLIEEVNDELKYEQYIKLWQKFAPYIGGIVVVTALGIGTTKWMEYRTTAQEQKAAAAYEAILESIKDKKPEEIQAKLDELKASAPKGYKGLALIKEADLLKDKEPAKAIEKFEAIAKDSSIDPLFKDLAVLSKAYLTFDQAEPAAMIELLKPLTKLDSAWRFGALELTALSHIKSGDKIQADYNLKLIMDDPAAPSGTKERAKKISEAFNIVEKKAVEKATDNIEIEEVVAEEPAQ